MKQLVHSTIPPVVPREFAVKHREFVDEALKIYDKHGVPNEESSLVMRSDLQVRLASKYEQWSQAHIDSAVKYCAHVADHKTEEFEDEMHKFVSSVRKENELQKYADHQIEHFSTKTAVCSELCGIERCQKLKNHLESLFAKFKVKNREAIQRHCQEAHDKSLQLVQDYTDHDTSYIMNDDELDNRLRAIQGIARDAFRDSCFLTFEQLNETITQDQRLLAQMDDIIQQAKDRNREMQRNRLFLLCLLWGFPIMYLAVELVLTRRRTNRRQQGTSSVSVSGPEWPHWWWFCAAAGMWIASFLWYSIPFSR